MRFIIYRSGVVRRGWRWRLRANNGQIIADSAEAYVSKADCLHGISLVQGSAGAPIVEK